MSTQSNRSSKKEKEKKDPVEEAMNWANKHLSKKGKSVADIQRDFCDGTNFLLLIEILSKKPIPVPWNAAPTAVHDKRKNIGAFLSLLTNNRYLKTGIVRPDDILWGEPNSTYTALRALNIYMDNGHLPTLPANYNYKNSEYYKTVQENNKNNKDKTQNGEDQEGENADNKRTSTKHRHRHSKSGTHHGSKGKDNNNGNDDENEDENGWDDDDVADGDNQRLFAGTADFTATLKSLNNSCDLSKSQEMHINDENDANNANNENGGRSGQGSRMSGKGSNLGSTSGGKNKNGENGEGGENGDGATSGTGEGAGEGANGEGRASNLLNSIGGGLVGDGSNADGNGAGGSKSGRSSKLSKTGGSTKGEDGNEDGAAGSKSGRSSKLNKTGGSTNGGDGDGDANGNGEGRATDLLNSVGNDLLGGQKGQDNENGEGGDENGDGTGEGSKNKNGANEDDDNEDNNGEIPEVKHSRYAMGIDLGTTFCRYGVFHDDNVDLNGLDNVIQSAVVFDGDNRIVGVVPMSLDNDENAVVVTDIKRIIGRDFTDPSLPTFLENLPYKVVEDSETHRPLVQVPVEGENQIFSAEQITAMLLSHVKELVSSQMGEEVTDAVISVPAYFTQVQRQATIDAGRIAGLNVIRIINEPAAAAVAYNAIHAGQSENGGENDNENKEDGNQGENEVKEILVYDMGGGKLDVSILQVEGGDMTTVKTTGDPNLGGLDFDNVLVNLILKDFKDKTGLNARESPLAMRRLKNEAEKLKITLSEQDEADLHIDDFYGGQDLDFHITREDFEKACEDLFKKAMEPLNDIFDGSADSVDKSSIKQVLLVGGSTKIPRLRRQLREFFDESIPFIDVDQNEAVCEGAAIQGAIIKGQKDAKLNGVSIHGSVLLSLGISCANGKNMIIIPRGSKLPVKRFTNATTIRDKQRNVGFDIVEGERPMAADNIKLGHVTVSGIQIAKRGVPKIEIAMTINEDGILIVTGRDITTHVAVTATVENKGNLPHDAVRKMIRQAEKEKFNDDLKMKRAERKTELVYFLERAENALKDENKTKNLKPADKAQFEQYVNDYKTWVEKHPDEIPSAYQRKYNTLYYALNKIMPVK
ncbi:Hsp70 chaperone [Tritrichomonas musculus]|uniref:Hsp70 chaperone n=1 Tax=Tritrichomonas musculus TaxID=1915356 RepID=A0ABR2JUL8_9EUKA